MEIKYYHLEYDTALEDDLAKNVFHWDFETLPERLPKNLPYHFICGMQDAVCPYETHVRPMLTSMKERGFFVSYREWDDGHSFLATRIHLASVVTNLLKTDESPSTGNQT